MLKLAETGRNIWKVHMILCSKGQDSLGGGKQMIPSINSVNHEGNCTAKEQAVSRLVNY